VKQAILLFARSIIITIKPTPLVQEAAAMRSQAAEMSLRKEGGWQVPWHRVMPEAGALLRLGARLRAAGGPAMAIVTTVSAAALVPHLVIN
jgi:hypothetical protein